MNTHRTYIDSTLKIAIVDDDQIYLDMWEHSLQPAQIALYETAESFLDDFEVGRFDLIISDLYFSATQMNGTELAKHIREKSPTQLLILSSNSFFLPAKSTSLFDLVVEKKSYSLDELVRLLPRPLP